MTRAISQKWNPKSEGILKDEVSENHPDSPESKRDLPAWYMEHARYADAEPLLLEAFHGRETKLGPEHPHTVESLKQLVTLYESWNKPDEAARWRANLVPTKAAED